MRDAQKRFGDQRIDNRILVVFVALALLTLLAAAPPVRHLRLTGSSPEKDAVLEASPAEVRLWFSLTPELAVSRIALSCHETEELGALEAGAENTLFVEVQGDLEPGDHVIAWRTSSGDGHPIRGTISFSTPSTH